MGCLQNKYRDTKLTDMEILALKDKHVLPTPEVLNSVLHDSYPAFEEWDNVLSGLDIKPEWNYYKDGKNLTFYINIISIFSYIIYLIMKFHNKHTK